MNSPIAKLLCLVLLAGPVAAALAGEAIDRTLDMPADGLVRVENVAGRVEFQTWDQARVRVSGEAGDDVEEVEVSSDSLGVQIRVRNREGVRRIDGTELVLQVPVTASIEARTVSADLILTGSRGENVLLKSVSGDIEVEASPVRIDINSVSGDVEFEGSAKRSSVETVSGDIILRGLEGELRVSTVSGDVALESSAMERAGFESVSGDLSLRLAVADGGRLTCDSLSGNIKLRLPATQQGRFDAQSFSGEIRSDFGRAQDVSRGPGSQLDYRQGQKDAEIRLESFSGDIEIRSD